MKIVDLVKQLDLTVYSGKDGMDRTISGGYVSDLLSDVMGNAKEGMAWVTLQTHINVMAIASLKDLAGVILVKGMKPDADTLEKSNEENIPLLGTRDETFELAGKLYNVLNKR